MTYAGSSGHGRGDAKAAPGRRDRRRFGLVIGSEGGGSPIDVHMKFREGVVSAGGQS